MKNPTINTGKQAVKIAKLFDSILENIHEVNTNLYREKLNSMDREQLGYEWSDRGGEEWEFERIINNHGMEFLIDMMVDEYSANHYEELF